MTMTPIRMQVDLSGQGLAPVGHRRLAADHGAALHRRAQERRRRARARRAARRRHGEVHGPLAAGQVRRRRARLRGADLVGRDQQSALRGALRRPQGKGRRAPRGAGSALRRRCVRRRRPGAPDRGSRDHREPVPRALREDDVHHAVRGRGALAHPDVVVLHAPEVEADPAVDGTRTGTFVVLHPSEGEVLVGGTFYAGEIKKAIFTVMNDRLPLEGVLPMHCSANVGEDGKVAIFFGLSGTGKTTLSADPERSLIGDDEHGWGSNGVFNIEGGCYAKVIRLSAEAEPEIFQTTKTYGTVLENVAVDERGVIDLDDDSKTENTRAAYKLERISNALATKMAGHPSSVVMLTADAFGILPPIARLSRDQALYYFLSGFTAKLAGTEIGVQEPQPTFSTCFGAPFLPQPPAVYARMLGEKLDRARRRRLARQHRLDGRPVRRGPPDADPGDPAPAPRGALGRARRRRLPHRRRLRLRAYPSRSRASSRRCSTRARPGATRRPTTRRPTSWRGCSLRTSSRVRRGRRRGGRRRRPARLRAAANERRLHRRRPRTRLHRPRVERPRRRRHRVVSCPWSHVRRARRRCRLRRHARGDRGARSGARRSPSSPSSTRREAIRARPREASTRPSATRPTTAPRRTRSTPSRAPTTSATRTRSRSSPPRRRATSTSSSTGAPSSRGTPRAGSTSARSGPPARRARSTRPTSPAMS